MANSRKAEEVGLENSTKEVPLRDLEEISELEFPVPGKGANQKDHDSTGDGPPTAGCSGRNAGYFT
jgi:hypothetical protein